MAHEDIRLASLPTGRVGPTWDDATGDAVFDDGEGHAVLSALTWHRGRAATDPTGNLGSRLHTIGMWTSSAPSAIKGFVLEALAPLVEENRISDPQPDARRLPRTTRISIEVRYRTRSGAQETARLGL